MQVLTEDSGYQRLYRKMMTTWRRQIAREPDVEILATSTELLGRRARSKADDSKICTVVRLGVNLEKRLKFELVSVSREKEDVTICRGFWALAAEMLSK
jgi:hypothetical protein